MYKRQRLEAAISGEPLDRIPIALWRHWQGDDQRAGDLAQSVVRFQQYYDWDMAIIAPAPHFLLTGYGLSDQYDGHPLGERTVTRRPVRRSLDWTELRPLDALRGDLSKQADCIQIVCDAPTLADTPVLQVIYSPLTQAFQLAEPEIVLRNMRTQPERFHSGLATLTETTSRFIETLKRSALAGIVYVMDQASYEYLAEQEYATFGLQYDQQIMSSLPTKWWLNIGCVAGKNPMLNLLAALPFQALNWNTAEGNPTLERGRGLVKGALMGGISRKMLHEATPSTLMDACRQALLTVNGRRMILAAERNIYITTPQSNIQAVSQLAAHTR